MTERLSQLRADVPCGPCHLCCRGDIILLMPDEGDVIESYQHDVFDTPSGPAAIVKKGADGNCIYLGPDGARSTTARPWSAGCSIAAACFSAGPATSVAP